MCLYVYMCLCIYIYIYIHIYTRISGACAACASWYLAALGYDDCGDGITIAVVDTPCGGEVLHVVFYMSRIKRAM